MPPLASWAYQRVPVFMADVKGDLTGISQAGHVSDKMAHALHERGIALPTPLACPVTLWDVFGAQGHPVRAIMIGLGAALIHEFSWILYVFGVFLALTGVKMLFSKLDEHPNLEDNFLVKWLRGHLRVTDRLHEQRFFVRQPDVSGKNVLWVTPLFLALILIECADLVFAIDSVPAIFAITQDPFIVYTSNIFAILGLRALYFALAAMIHRFAYLKYALALVLVFIGAKIFLVGIIGKIPPVISLSVTLGLLIGGVLLSLYKTRNQGPLLDEQAAK